MKTLNRREFVRLSGTVGGTVLLGSLFGCSPAAPSAAPDHSLARLLIQGPASPPTLPLAYLVHADLLGSVVPATGFEIWKNPDELRGRVVAGQAHLSGTPTYVAANFYNRGVPVRLLNVTTWGTLYVLTTDPGVTEWADLKGRELYAPFKGDMPDLVFRYLALENGLNPAADMHIHYVASPTEAVQMLLSDRTDIAVIPEPAATSAQMRGRGEGIEVRRALNLQQEWGRITGGPPRMPQAGTLALPALVQDHPQVVSRFQAALSEAVDWVNANPAAAAELATAYFPGIQAPMVERSLGHTHLEFQTAAAVRDELQDFFARLATLSPEIIGGALPDADFYAAG